ncbi:MAG: RNA 3'-terminal phosphate cyclase [Anaerolineales bacterium]|nr:MAG: RNA 3'-terminal phosphate cyclase [Anaerolineales bacterium]
MKAMIELDGAVGEGGGQILRSALTLSLLTQQPFRIQNVRARRLKPGLRPQHLAAVRAATAISQSRAEGAEPGSQTLTFLPGSTHSGGYAFDIGTAGAATLVLQTVLIPLCLADGDSRVIIQGGTHVPWSPCVDYLTLAWLPFLARLGLEAKITCERAGFYPRGGGLLEAEIRGTAVPAAHELNDRGALEGLIIRSAVANLPDHIADRQAKQAQQRLSRWDVPIDVERTRVQSPGQGTMLLILPQFERGYACFSALGKLGIPAELVADEAVDQFEDFMTRPGGVDPFLADQILIPLALAILPSQFTTPSVTNHLRTNASVIQAFGVADIEIIGAPGQSGQICIDPRRPPVHG